MLLLSPPLTLCSSLNDGSRAKHPSVCLLYLVSLTSLCLTQDNASPLSKLSFLSFVFLHSWNCLEAPEALVETSPRNKDTKMQREK